jgi:hypothetical protein
MEYTCSPPINLIKYYTTYENLKTCLETISTSYNWLDLNGQELQVSKMS